MCSVAQSCLFETPWTVACQVPLSMGFSKQEYGSGLPFLPPGDLPGPGIEAASLAWAGGLFTTVPPGKPLSLLQRAFNDFTCWHLPLDQDPQHDEVFFTNIGIET